MGKPAPGNVPGSRSGSASWTDSSGNLWLFDGGGYDTNNNEGYLNDLWEFSPTTNEWAWMGGSSTIGSKDGQPGVYGTLETPAAGNFPGSRDGSPNWTDASGHFWLFGGWGLDASGTLGSLNDLWEISACISLPTGRRANYLARSRLLYRCAVGDDLRCDCGRGHLLHPRRIYADHEFLRVQRAILRLSRRRPSMPLPWPVAIDIVQLPLSPTPSHRRRLRLSRWSRGQCDGQHDRVADRFVAGFRMGCRLIDGAPLSNVKVYIDGNLVGTPTLGIAPARYRGGSRVSQRRLHRRRIPVALLRGVALSGYARRHRSCRSRTRAGGQPPSAPSPSRLPRRRLRLRRSALSMQAVEQ